MDPIIVEHVTPVAQLTARLLGFSGEAWKAIAAGFVHQRGITYWTDYPHVQDFNVAAWPSTQHINSEGAGIVLVAYGMLLERPAMYKEFVDAGRSGHPPDVLKILAGLWGTQITTLAQELFPPTPTTPAEYAQAIVEGLGGKPNDTVGVHLVEAMMQEEGTSDPNSPNYVDKIHNPLDSVMPETGATDYNSAGVKDYPTAAEGIAANVATMNQTEFKDLKDAIVQGDAKEFFQGTGATELSQWATGHAGDTAYPKALQTVFDAQTTAASTKSIPGKGVTMQAGDTLWGIATAHGITIQKLYALNPQLHHDPHNATIGTFIHL